MRILKLSGALIKPQLVVEINYGVVSTNLANPFDPTNHILIRIPYTVPAEDYAGTTDTKLVWTPPYIPSGHLLNPTLP